MTCITLSHSPTFFCAADAVNAVHERSTHEWLFRFVHPIAGASRDQARRAWRNTCRYEQQSIRHISIPRHQNVLTASVEHDAHSHLGNFDLRTVDEAVEGMVSAAVIKLTPSPLTQHAHPEDGRRYANATSLHHPHHKNAKRKHRVGQRNGSKEVIHEQEIPAAGRKDGARKSAALRLLRQAQQPGRGRAASVSATWWWPTSGESTRTSQ